MTSFRRGHPSLGADAGRRPSTPAAGLAEAQTRTPWRRIPLASLGSVATFLFLTQ
jgi:hypothetical protein